MGTFSRMARTGRGFRAALVRPGADTLGVPVVDVRRASGQVTCWHGENVLIPRLLIARLSGRPLAPASTALLVGGAAAVLVAAIETFSHGANGSGNGQPPPIPK